MSMLSAQCDELRERAGELRSFADGLTAPYVIPSTKEVMGLAMNSAASRMEDAADTIWELRNDCAGLRGECEDWKRIAVEMNVNAINAVDVCEAENDKLRELVRYAYECATHSDHATCDECRGMNGYCILQRRMRELEV